MTLQKVTDVRAPTVMPWAPLPTASASELATVVLRFLDAASTSLGRATAYNERATQQAAELAAHEALLRLDRGLYALLLALSGTTDHARQIGVKNLLGARADESPRSFGEDVERRVLDRLDRGTAGPATLPALRRSADRRRSGGAAAREQRTDAQADPARAPRRPAPRAVDGEVPEAAGRGADACMGTADDERRPRNPRA
jgi:hypothetical protein